MKYRIPGLALSLAAAAFGMGGRPRSTLSNDNGFLTHKNARRRHIGPSVRTHLENARTIVELRLAWAKAGLYAKASNKTRRRWREVYERRLAELSNHNS